MDIRFRKANNNDALAILNLEKSVSSLTYHAKTTTDEVIKDYLIKGHVFLVLGNGKKLIGMISYETKEGSHVYLNGLIVLPEYQNQGIASKALEFILDKLKDIERIDLITHPNNNSALRLYLKYGFEIEAWKENYYGDGEPRLVLTKIKQGKQYIGIKGLSNISCW